MKTKTKQIIWYGVLIIVISFIIFSFHYTAITVYNNLEHDFGTGVVFGVTQTMALVSWVLLFITVMKLINLFFTKKRE